MPSRITSYSASLIDHIYRYQGNFRRDTVDIKSGNLLGDITDHLANYTILVNKKSTVERGPKIHVYSKKTLIYSKNA
jgi:hypothetical protein